MIRRIDIVLVAYNLPDDLLRFVRAAGAPNVWIHLFLHSNIPAVMAACEQIVREYPRLYYYAYRQNRGLSCSWNEGLLAAYRDGADVAMIANDDVIPAPRDVEKLAQASVEHRDCFHIVGRMFNLPGLNFVDSQFGLCAINPIALETIGCFDENIFPIYWEDIDYVRRARLAGLPEWKVDDTAIIHLGSKSSAGKPEVHAYLSQFFNLNQDYYHRKWNGGIGTEKYPTPFNDPAIGYYIAPEDRHAPYPGYNRTDQEIVRY